MFNDNSQHKMSHTYKWSRADTYNYHYRPGMAVSGDTKQYQDVLWLSVNNTCYVLLSYSIELDLVSDLKQHRQTVTLRPLR